MTRLFRVYQYAGPLISLPLAAWAWHRFFAGDPRMTLAALAIPVTFAYLVPLLGASWLGMWEIRTRPVVGGVRPHHGFVFGSAAALLAWLAMPPMAGDNAVLAALRAGFVVGSVLGFWNWLYDLYAIRTGVIRIHRQPHQASLSPEALASDHGPAYFGSFGFCYGVSLHLLYYCVATTGRGDLFWPLLLACAAVSSAIPVACYALLSYARYGVSGIRMMKGS